MIAASHESSKFSGLGRVVGGASGDVAPAPPRIRLANDAACRLAASHVSARVGWQPAFLGFAPSQLFFVRQSMPEWASGCWDASSFSMHALKEPWSRARRKVDGFPAILARRKAFNTPRKQLEAFAPCISALVVRSASDWTA